MTNRVNCSKTILALALCIGALGVRAATFFDDFESYVVGSNLHGQGGWAGWSNNPNAGALVSTNFSFSPTRSVNITGASDLVHTFSDATNGQWVFSLMQYIPSTSTGTTYVVLMNTYRPPYVGADLNWSVIIQNNMATGQIISDIGGGATLPIVNDRWVEVRCEINLASNSVSEFYNGQLLSTHAWQDGTGVNEIQALDLFANNAGPVYYDNVSLGASGTCPGLWTQRSPLTPSPSAREHHAMAYDSLRSRTVLFGGDNPSYLGDTWELDGAIWTQVAVTGPSARNETAMAYDTAHGVVVLFGGGQNNNPQSNNNTWLWNGTTWIRVFPAVSPSARVRHAMAYDSARGVVVLFGGVDASGPGGSLVDKSDTWEWNGTTWTLVSTNGPSARESHAMAYDSGRGKTVLFGGFNGARLGDTWEWNGTTWTQVANTGPTGRSDLALAYDSGCCAQTILFGGYDANGTTGRTSDTWGWNGTAWSQVPTSGPSARNGQKMAYDSNRGRLVLFGGYALPAGVNGETWEFVQCVTPSPPVITQEPQSVTTVVGQPAVFAVVVNPSPIKPSYQWERNITGSFQSIVGATNASYTIVSATLNDAGLYHCVVQVLGYTVTSLNAVLTMSLEDSGNSNPISGKVGFCCSCFPYDYYTNPDPNSPVQNYLDDILNNTSVFDHGTVYASTCGYGGIPCLTSSQSALNLWTGTVDATYVLPVDTSGRLCTATPTTSDYIYDFCASMYLLEPYPSTIQNEYNFSGKKYIKVCYQGALPAVDFCECPALVTINFVQCGNNAHVVVSGDVKGYDPSGASCFHDWQAEGSIVNASKKQLLVRGNIHNYHIHVEVKVGSDPYTTQFTFPPVDLTFDTFCNQETNLTVVLCRCEGPNCTSCPDAQITGQVRMVGESPYLVTYGGDTRTWMRAMHGPSNNYRYAFVPLDPSQGTFNLINIFPSSVTPYQVWAEMCFRSEYSYEYFVSPYTNVFVPCGPAVDLDKTFMMDPGFVNGSILLRGPVDAVNSPSCLRYILRSPGSPPLNDLELTFSCVQAASTAGNGWAHVNFDGGFGQSTDFKGKYELVLSGLKQPPFSSQPPSDWWANRLQLQFVNTGTANSPDIFSQLNIIDNTFGVQTIQKDTQIQHDINYCFSQVVVDVSAGGGILSYLPHLAGGDGLFVGTDFLKKPANYSVNNVYANGTPKTLPDASASGQIVLFLPEGTYNLDPVVYTVSGSVTALKPIKNLIVGCGQTIHVTSGLQITVAQVCTKSPRTPITAQVTSENPVTQMTYVLNGGAAMPVPVTGVSPTVTFFPEPLHPCENTLTVTAIDNSNPPKTASVTTKIIFDDTPPVITCPADKTVSCGSSWSFDTPTAVDSCSGSDVAITALGRVTNGVCPPTITQTWLVTDPCGNSTNCSQTVTVLIPNTACPPLRTRPNLNSITVYEVTSLPDNPHTFLLSDPSWQGQIAGDPSTLNFDFTTAAHEFYDVYLSDPDGTANLNGCSVTIVCNMLGDYGPNNQTGNNIDAVELNFAGGLNVGASSLGKVQLGTEITDPVLLASDGDAATALGLHDGNFTHLGNKISRITVCFPQDCFSAKAVKAGSNWRFDEPTDYSSCCGTNVTVTILSTVTNGTPCAQVITRTWEVTDCCTNKTTCSQAVTNIESTPPLITACPTNLTVTNCCLATIPDFRLQVLATDNCAQAAQLTFTQTPQPGLQVGPGTYPIGIQVCDPSGNCAQCVVMYTVVCTNCLPPYIIIQPQSVTFVGQAASPGNPAIFTVLAGGTPPLTYQWYRGAVALVDGPKVAGSQTSTLTIKGDLGGSSHPFLPTDRGPYTVQISNPCGTNTSSIGGIYYLFIANTNHGIGPGLYFSSDTNFTYDVYYRNDLGPTTPWQLLESVIGTGTNNTVVDPHPNPVMRFYRVVPQPGP